MPPFDRLPAHSSFISGYHISYGPGPYEWESRPDTFELRPDSLEPQPDSVENPPFKKLPTELIVSIAELLPLHSAALFTLTCRLVSFALGTKYLDQLRAKPETHRTEQFTFLGTLQRDLPRYILCYDCGLLHSKTVQRRDTGERSAITPCARQDWASRVDQYIQTRFSSVTFRLAMKLHRHGLDCSKQLSSLSRCLSVALTLYNRQWESTPRIVNGHFLLRNQIWHFFPLGRAVKVSAFPIGEICPHLKFPRAGLACRVRHIKNAKLNATCRTCTGMFQCKDCPTEYRIDYKDFGDGVALIVTSWLDLGEGRTASDPMYQSHVLCNTFPQYQLDLPPIEVGSIRAAYEEEGFLSPKHSVNMFTNNQLPLPRENLIVSEIKHTTKRDQQKETEPLGPTEERATTIPIVDTPDIVVPKETTIARAPILISPACQYVINLFIFLNAYGSTTDFQVFGLVIALAIVDDFPAWKDSSVVLGVLATLQFLARFPACQYAVNAIGLQDSLSFPRLQSAIATFVLGSTLRLTNQCQNVANYMGDKFRSLSGMVLQPKGRAEQLFAATTIIGGADGAADDREASLLVVEEKVGTNRPLKSGGRKLSARKHDQGGPVSLGQGRGSGIAAAALGVASGIEIENGKDRIGGRIWKLGANGRLIPREREKRLWK